MNLRKTPFLFYARFTQTVCVKRALPFQGKAFYAKRVKRTRSLPQNLRITLPGQNGCSRTSAQSASH